jgi:hypothetical protein
VHVSPPAAAPDIEVSPSPKSGGFIDYVPFIHKDYLLRIANIIFLFAADRNSDHIEIPAGIYAK